MFKVVQTVYFITPVIGGMWIMGQVTEGGAWHQGAAGEGNPRPARTQGATLPCQAVAILVTL